MISKVQTIIKLKTLKKLNNYKKAIYTMKRTKPSSNPNYKNPH